MNNSAEFTKIELCNVRDQKYSYRSLLDYKLGKIQLTKHFSINEICSLSVSSEYGKQLLLEKPSSLKSGRVPLFVCECCADLGCGALTVEVVETEAGFMWREFGYENNFEEGFYQTKYMANTGPFYFEKVQYISTIKPYA